MKSSVVALCVLATALLSACAYVGGPGAANSPVPTVTPVVGDVDRTPEITDPPLPTYEKSPNPTPSRSPWTLPDCYNVQWTVAPPTGLTSLGHVAADVFVGDFNGYGEASWTTPDGKRPTTDEVENADYDVTIIRDVEFGVSDLVRGSDADVADAYVRGGSIGCDSVAYDNMPELTPGSRAVYFLMTLPVGERGSPDRHQLIAVWPISADDVITTDAGSPMTLSDFTEALDQVKYSPSQP
jgi:hypothetical protein